MMRIEYACNNPDNGMDTGHSEFIHIIRDATDNPIELVGGRIVTRLTGDVGGWHMQFGRLQMKPIGYRYGVGNWCWDFVSVKDEDARRVFNYLAKRQDWHCESAEDFWFDAFNAHRTFSPKEWAKGGAA